MSRAFTYFRLSLKRTFKLFPFVLILSSVLCASMGLILWNLLYANESDEQKQPITIAVTGDVNDPYLKLGMAAAQHMDSTRFSVNLVTVSEDEAREMLKNDEISGYLNIPESFFVKAVDGDLGTLTFVSSSGTVDFGKKLTNNILQAATRIVFYSQKSSRGFYHAALAAGFGREEALEIDETLILYYVDYILERTGVYSVENTGFSGASGSSGSLVYGIGLEFILIWGITCCTVFAAKKDSLARVLAAKGTGPLAQISGEYASYFLFILTTVSVILTAAMIIVGSKADFGDVSFPRLAASLLLPVAVISAMHFFLYEITRGIVSGVLLQFLCAVGMGYVTGCIYPAYFFPESVQRAARFLPSGAARIFLASGTEGSFMPVEFLILIGYFAVFFFGSVLLRRRRIAMEGGAL